jgi:hypothetical protein
MGKPLEKILLKIGMKEKKFIEICDNFTNKKIFKTDQAGKLIKDKEGSLIKIKYDELK